MRLGQTQFPATHIWPPMQFAVPQHSWQIPPQSISAGGHLQTES
jgi:hypothetical protein